MDLTSLLQETLASHGYRTEQAPALEGRSGATYPANLLAHQNDHRLLIDVTTTPLSDADIQALDAIVQDTGVDAALLLALADEGDTSTTTPRVTVWTRPQLEQAIGAQLLNDTLDDETDPSHIGPTPFDPDQLPQTPVTHDEETAEDPIPQPSNAEPETSPPPQAQPQPEPEPEPASATPSPSPDPSTSPPETKPRPSKPTPAQANASNGGGYMDPEEMAKRAQEMLEQGDIPDDGDAEIITNDDPQPAPQRESPPAAPDAARQADPPPEPEPPTAAEPQPEPAQEGQVFEDADCEILPSKPRATQDQAPDREEAPANEPANEPSPSPAPESTGEAPSSLAALTADTTTRQGEQDPFLSGGCIPPTVTEEQAREAAKGALFNVQEARLELLPFHVFQYNCQLEGDGKAREEEGRVWISAQNGAIVNEPENADLIDDPGIPHERYQANLTPHQGKSKALQHLQGSLERREELREDYSETAIIERVTLKPNPESLTLDHQGTAYAPRWRLDGQNGNVYVDALTGEIVPA